MKTKALIICAVTVQLICVFVFADAKDRFYMYHHSAGLIYPQGVQCNYHSMGNSGQIFRFVKISLSRLMWLCGSK